LDEHARIRAKLDKCEQMLQRMASPDDPGLLPAIAEVQQIALELRAQLKAIETRSTAK
jgi:hypothetical protein